MKTNSLSRLPNGVEIYRFRNLDQLFPPHFHKYWVMGILTRGERRIRAADLSRESQAGDVVIIMPGQVHSCEKIGHSDNDWIGVSIPARFFPRDLRVDNFPSLDAKAKTLCLKLIDSLSRTRDATPVVEFIMSLGITESKKTGLPDKNIGLELIRNALEKNMDQKFGLDEMSASLKIDKYSLLRRFSLRFNLTPRQYLQSLRIARAGEALLAGVSISESAQLAGLYDQSHLGALFRRYLGFSPAAWRDAKSAKFVELKKKLDK